MTIGHVPAPAGATVAPQATQENGITVRTYTAVTTESTKVYRAASEKPDVPRITLDKRSSISRLFSTKIT